MAVPRKTLLLRGGLVLLVLLIGVGGYALVTSLSVIRELGPVAAEPTPEEKVTFADRRAGIELSYPQDWVQIENNAQADLTDNEASQVRFIAGPSQDQAALKVRVVPLPEEIVYDPDMSAADLLTIRETLDALIYGPSVEVQSVRPINHKGLLGFHYLYSFRQESTGREGVHSHYFVFDGAKMNVLVFEALPRTEFEGLANTFDQIFESFSSERRTAPEAAEPAA